jgi:hypothetical protein
MPGPSAQAGKIIRSAGPQRRHRGVRAQPRASTLAGCSASREARLAAQRYGENVTDEDDSAVAPPWQVFPEITPEDVPAHMRQGRAEPYFDLVWRPFWSTLSAAHRSAYLDRWNASAAWRAAMTHFDVDATFDLEQDALESADYLAGMRRQREEAWRKLPMWKRWFTRR